MSAINNMPSTERRRKRWVLMWAQGCICPACGGLLDGDVAPEEPLYPTLDHIQTRGRGGANTLANMLVKHRFCNETRGDRESGSRDAEALQLVAERLKGRPVTVAECEAVAREILASRRASRLHQPNAHRQYAALGRLAESAR